MKIQDAPFAKRTRQVSGFLALVAVTVFLCILDLSRGELPIGPRAMLSLAVDSFRPVADRAYSTEHPSLALAFYAFRVPKTMTALFAGAALALAGLLLQSLFRNALAGPDILGCSSGASIGVALQLLASSSSLPFLGGLSAGTSVVGRFAGTGGLILSSSLGAAVVLVLILAIARFLENDISVLVTGLIISSIAGSVISLLLAYAFPGRVPLYLAWTLGSFQSTSATDVLALIPFVSLCFVTAFFLSKRLDLLFLGPRYGASLGLNHRALRLAVIALSSLLTGAVTAFCGPVAFLGIAAPHAGRNIFRTDKHSILIPASMLSGAIIALGADIVSGLPGGGNVIPINPLLALVGGPAILVIFLKGRRRA